MTEKEFHNKIVWMTFIFGVLVVMVHAYNVDLYVTAGMGGAFANGLERIQSVISAAMPTIAVPGFFMVSAYLFFRNVSWQNITQKMGRRVGSVLVPYIAWTSLYYVVFSIGGNFPALWGMLGRESVPFSLAGLADAIINYTYNPVLWYLKQLIILIAIAPAVYVMMSRVWIGAVALLLIFMVAGQGIIIPILNLDALLYYCLGAYLAMHGRGLVEKKYGSSNNDKVKRYSLAIFLAALAVCLYVGSGRYSSIFMIVMFAIVSPATVWILLPSELPRAKPYMKFSLFLYAFHFLPVRTINKIGALLLPHNAVSAMAVYVILPVIVVLLTWGLAEFLKKKIPPLWKLLSGGR